MLAGAVAALAGASVLAGGASVALADGNGPGDTGPGYHNGAYINNLDGTGNAYWFCIAGGRAEPADAISYVVTSPTAWVTDAAHDLYDTGDPAIGSGDDETYEALGYFDHITPELPHNDRPGWTLPASYPVAKVAEIQAAAAAFAGPYAAQVSLTQGDRDGMAHVGVTSAAGNYMSPIAGHAILVGGAVFTATGNQDIDFTTVNGLLDIPITATGPEAAYISVTFSGLSDGTVRLATAPAGSGYQDAVAKSTGTAPVSGTARFDHPFVLDFQPQVTTQASSARSQVGVPFADNLLVSVANGGSWIGGPLNVNSVAFGPLNDFPVQAPTAPAGTPVLGTVTTSVTGPGAYVTPSLTPSVEGIYTFQEDIPEGDWNLPWLGQYGVAAETVVVPWSPEVTTQTQHPLVDVGVVTWDNARITKGQPGHVYTVTHTQWTNETYMEPGQPIPATATVEHTVTSTVTAGPDGTVDFRSPEVTATVSGYKAWTESIPEDQTNNGWNGSTVRSEESFITKWQPTITSTVATATLQAGETQTEMLDVAGVHPTQDTEIDVTVYRTDNAAVDWAGLTEPPADAEVAGTGTLTANGFGQYSWDFTPDKPGDYAFWSTTDGNEYTHAFQPPVFPETSEQFQVPWSPKVSTQASSLTGELGDISTDGLTVTDAEPNSTVVVESPFWGVFLDKIPHIAREGGNTVLQGQEHTPVVVASGEPNTGRILASYSTEVKIGPDGTGTATTEGYKIAAHGFYSWTATVRATDRSNGYESDFGVPEESLGSPWHPLVYTEASDQSSAKGAYVTDKAYVEGLPPNYGELPAAWDLTTQPVALPVEAWTSPAITLANPVAPETYGQHPTDNTTLTFRLYGPVPEKPGGELPADAKIVGTVTAILRNGEIVSPEVGPLPATTWYGFVESIEGSERVTPHTGKWGASSETIFVPETPPPGTPGSPGSPGSPGAPGNPGAPGAGAGANVSVRGTALASTGVSQGTLLPATLIGFGLLLGGIGLTFVGRDTRTALVAAVARGRHRRTVDNS